jgi:OmpA-OmpF porin, OOP family
MKTFLPILFTYFFCISFYSQAQNLVPDSSFEKVHRFPTKKNNPLACTKNWMSPTNGASDYYHIKGKKHAGVPRNVFGKQKPHSGDAYAGICVRTNFIEYVQTQLTDTLEKGRDYLVEFYVSRAERSIGKVREFGVLFTRKMAWGMTDKGIQEIPDIEFLKPSGYKTKKKWTKFSAVYHAKGNELVFILGPFMNSHFKRYRGYAHYYIDDVSITQIKIKTDSIKDLEVIDVMPKKKYSPKIGETITLENIFFMTNKSELLNESFMEIDKLVQFLNETIYTSILISGHTDNTGNEIQNKILSKGRAKAVADYLILKGINKSRINYIGYGSSKPITENDTEDGKQSNRRVEFIINKNN